jgi:hypothetical protein
MEVLFSFSWNGVSQSLGFLGRRFSPMMGTDPER